jgi:glycine cleavage system aminomethyltransferase T
MSGLDPRRFREDWLNASQFDRDFYVDRPVVFSPAAAPQERANRSNMLWRWAPIWLPWEFSHWIEEGRSFHDSAYIGDWSGLTKVHVSGPESLAFLSHVGTNDLSGFEVGQIKHHIQTSADGKVAAEGVLYRLGENEFRYTGGNAAWMHHVCGEGDWDAQTVVESPDIFAFEVQGPRSLALLEDATGESLRDIGFNRCRPSRIAGVDLLVLRTGISGELGYELHGPSEHAALVWESVVDAGKAHGIVLLGARAQIISHTEAGIATNTLDYITASQGTAGQSPVNNGSGIIGSAATDDFRDFFRSPYELGWGSRVAIDSHDFIGRDALAAEREADGPVRQLGGLVWNSEDVVEVFASLFRPEGPVPMEMPRIRTLEASEIVADGEVVGCATSRVYSPFLRKMISLCHLDRRFLAPGTDVTVVWGDADGPQQEIRAEVIELPFKPDRRRIDVTNKTSSNDIPAG